jgi:serine phosphatase RsbU (regulator of sigma subunit)
MSLSVLEPAENRLTFCSAGHFPMMIRRANGEVEELGGDISGFPLGIMPNLTYEKMATILAPGDVVIIYSDGVTDARSPKEELYDSQENRRLRKRVVESSGSPRAVGRSIMQEIREFSAGRHQADDITLVCFGPVAQSPSE